MLNFKSLRKSFLILSSLFFFTIFTFETVSATGGSSLAAGDIAFIGLNSDGDDDFSLLLLKDITAGTSFYITDKGWNDGAGFYSDTADGTWQWSTSTALSAGDIIHIKTSNAGATIPDAFVSTPGNMSWVHSGAIISYMGDQIFIYQGSEASPTFIAGVHWNVESGSSTGNWDGSATTMKTSALPNNLTNGTNAIWLYAPGPTEKDNFKYNCSTTSGTPAALRTAINNISNWAVDVSNTTAYTINPFPCSFTVNSATDINPPVIACAPTPSPIVAGSNGMAAIPDLVTATTATDDVSISANITIVQSPAVGAMVNTGVHSVILTATDQAGNFATCTINVTVNEPPSTTLSAGDIAFIGINSDGNNDFVFVLLKDIISGTKINITDHGWMDGSSSFRNEGGDGVLVWYATDNMSAGTIVHFQTTNNGSTLASAVSSQGSITGNTVVSQLGDQLFIYQGTSLSPTFITGIHWNVEPTSNSLNWDDGAAVSLYATTSDLPDQLTNGVNAIWVYQTGPTEKDNFRYKCLAGTSGSAVELRALFNNINNWDVDPLDNTPYTINPFSCSFTVSDSAIAPTVTTNIASTIDQQSAILNGTINPNYTSTTATFQYGLTTSYGSTVTANQSPISGSSDVSVNKAITALNSNTTYHYRSVGTNSAGTTNGSDQTFTTLAPLPVYSQGDVIVTEMMINPNAVSDTNGEWIELYNTTNNTVNLNGWTISDQGTNSYTITESLIVGNDDYIVLARNGSGAVNGGLSAEHVYTSFVLDNIVDEIILTQSGGGVVDMVTYDTSSGWTVTAGASLALTNFTGDHNDPSNWTESTLSYGDGDFGTPGSVHAVLVYCSGVISTDPNVCSGKGVCENDDTCTCDAGWTGNDCEFNYWTCDNLGHDDPFVCSDGQGTCVAEDMCVCNPGFKGSFCQFPIIAGFQCFDFLSEEPEVCSGRGSCIEDDTCVCEAGYYGEECQFTMSCNGVSIFEPGVCSGKGTCENDETCTCDADWGGADCDTFIGKTCFGIPYLNSSVCSGNGTCSTQDTCVCDAGYTGATCNTEIQCNGILQAAPNVCSSNGVCEDDGTCTCEAGFDGANCANALCSAGQYYTTSSSSCISCSVGYYQDEAGQTSCKRCAVGTFASTTGSASCNACTAGTFTSTEGSMNCAQCSAGFYQDEIGQSSCKQCSSGTSTQGSTSCSTCLAGTYYDAGSNTCISCTVGYYQNEAGQTSCNRCAVGTFTLTTGSASCNACTAGTFTSTEGSMNCTSCSTGYYQDKVGQSSCEQCSAGTFASTTGCSSCTLCSAGTTSDVGATVCYAIPPDTPTHFAGGLLDGEVNLTWDVTAYATGYKVSRSTDGGSGYTLLTSPANSSYIDSAVTSGNTYYYKVAATNSAGDSDLTVAILLTISSNTVITSSTEGQADLPAGTTEMTLSGSAVIDLSGNMKSSTGGTVTVGGNAKTLNNFTSGDLSGIDLSGTQKVGDQNVKMETFVKLESGTNGTPITIENSDFSTGQLSIPDGTTIMGPSGWNGQIVPPQAESIAGTTAPSGFSVGNVIVEVGAAGQVLLFDQPVSVIINGIHSNVAYKPAGSTKWVKIKTRCAGTYANPTAPTFPGECYITDSGTNKTKIYTFHLTSFANLTANLSSSSSSSSGGGGGFNYKILPYTLPTTVSVTVANVTNRGLDLSKTNGVTSRPILMKNTAFGISLEIPQETIITTNDGNYMGIIKMPERLSRHLTPAIPSNYKKIFGVEIETDKTVSFDKTVTLTLPVELLDETKPENIKVFYYNEETKKYELAGKGGALSNDEKSISVEVNHLTKFVVMDTNGEEMPGIVMGNISEFEDINGHWAYDYITQLYDKGAVSGKSTNVFSPDTTITRAELTKMVLLAFNYDVLEEVTESSFKDIERNSWYAPYIVKAKELRLIEGYIDGTFKPNQEINRVEALKIILAGSKLEIAGGKMEFNDIISGSWYEKYLAYAQLKQVVGGYGDRIFSPSSNITRAECSKIIVKTLGLK